MMRTAFDRNDEVPDETTSLTLADGCCPTGGACPPRQTGSRRRRLWDLGSHAHCPVVGLCLPVVVLRRLMQRHLANVPGDDYELHGHGVGASRQRNALSEAMQRELDTRHALCLREGAQHKDAAALRAWWLARRHGPQMAGVLWAVLTHARCDPSLEDRVLGEVHMQQHEVGQLARALADRQQQMQVQQDRLQREHQQMSTRLEQAARIAAQERERLQADQVRLRGIVLAREARIEQLEAEAAELRRARPDLPSRQELSQQVADQTRRMRDLQRALDRTRAEAEAAIRPAPPAATADVVPPNEARPDALRSRAVLCVGGRTGAVPTYRRVVEAAGAQFLHHDGGEEDNVQRLEHTLAAADLVICQTGCVSHDAYWRVKDHCRRTGKRCLFIEQPSISGLQRALGAICRSAAADDS